MVIEISYGNRMEQTLQASRIPPEPLRNHVDCLTPSQSFSTGMIVFLFFVFLS